MGLGRGQRWQMQVPPARNRPGQMGAAWHVSLLSIMRLSRHVPQKEPEARPACQTQAQEEGRQALLRRRGVLGAAAAAVGAPAAQLMAWLLLIAIASSARLPLLPLPPTPTPLLPRA